MGIKGLLNLQRVSIPPVDFATALITTFYPGSSPTEVEELVTAKIENEIRSINHLRDVHSVSQPGLSLIRIRIDIDKADTAKVVNDLHQALQNVQGLPSEILNPPKLIHIDSSNETPIIHILVSGPDNKRLRDEISWNLKAKLEKISGVSEITMNNYKNREFLVLLSQKKMEKHYISSADVISTLEQKKMDVPAGYLESNTNRKLVRVLGKPRTIKDIENTIVRSNFSGQMIFIKDIAKVIDGSEKETQREYFYKSKNNEPYKLSPVTSLTITKTGDADIITLIANIKKFFKSLRRNWIRTIKFLLALTKEIIQRGVFPV